MSLHIIVNRGATDFRIRIIQCQNTDPTHQCDDTFIHPLCMAAGQEANPDTTTRELFDTAKATAQRLTCHAQDS